jgi:hypothetical protein
MPSGFRNSCRSISPGWVGGRRSGINTMTVPSVIVDYLDLLRAGVCPGEADAVLIIDPASAQADAVAV